MKSNKTNNNYRWGLLVAVSMGLSGCSWFSANDGREDIDDRYMASKQTKALQVPAEATELKVDDKFQVPQGVILTEREAKGQLLSLEPPKLLLIGGDGIREDKDAKYPTIWLRNSSKELMKSIEAFSKNQQVVLADTSSDSVHTDWIDDDSDAPIAQRIGPYNIEGQRHKFALNILPAQNSEIGLQAVHTASQHEIDGDWESVSTSNGVAKQFLNNFITFYDMQQARIARLKILEEGTIKTRLGADNQGNMAIVTERDFQDVWQQLAKVLPQLGLEIIDRDQSQGLYYYVVNEDSGFWGSMFSDELQSEVNLEAGEYQILVERLNAGGTSMSLRDSEGGLLSTSKVSEIYPEISAAFRARAKEE